MALNRNSCRITERVTMKQLYNQGRSVEYISSQLRVAPHIITEVIEGKWDEKEKAMTLAAMKKNEELLIGKADEEANKIAQIAAAAAAAIQGVSPVVDPAAFRAKLEAEIRAEIEAEAKPKRKRRSKEQMEADEANSDASDDQTLQAAGQ